MPRLHDTVHGVYIFSWLGLTPLGAYISQTKCTLVGLFLPKLACDCVLGITECKLFLIDSSLWNLLHPNPYFGHNKYILSLIQRFDCCPMCNFSIIISPKILEHNWNIVYCICRKQSFSLLPSEGLGYMLQGIIVTQL